MSARGLCREQSLDAERRKLQLLVFSHTDQLFTYTYLDSQGELCLPSSAWPMRVMVLSISPWV